MGTKSILQLLAALLVGLFLAFGIGKIRSVWNEYNELKNYKQEAEARGESAEATTETLSGALTGKQEVVVRVMQERARRDQEFEELKNAQPSVRAWAEQPIPLQLRESAEGEPPVQ